MSEPTTLDRLNLVKQSKNFRYKCNEEARLKQLFAKFTAECYSQSQFDEFS